MKPRNIAMLAVTILALGAVAQAATETQTASVSSQVTDFSVDVTPTIAQFNPSLGTLESVSISFSGGDTTTFFATNTDGSTQYVGSKLGTSSFETDTNLFLDSSSGALDTILMSNLSGIDLPASSPTFSKIVVNGHGQYVSGGIVVPNGTTKSWGPYVNTGAEGPVSITSGLAPFIGASNLGLYIDTATSTTTPGSLGGNTDEYQTTVADGSVTVVYNYNPPAVPEGGAAGLYLLMAGLVCFGAMRFKSNSQFGSTMA